MSVSYTHLPELLSSSPRATLIPILTPEAGPLLSLVATATPEPEPLRLFMGFAMDDWDDTFRAVETPSPSPTPSPTPVLYAAYMEYFPEGDGISGSSQVAVDVGLERWSEYDDASGGLVRVGGMEASCSSYRSSNTYLCDASCAFDGDSTSAWNSNDDRNGQWLNVEWPIGTQRIAGFAVINGYAKNSDVWTNNSRVRLIAVYADGEDYLGTFYLRDDEQTQYFPIDGGVVCSSLLFRFTATYAGARYDDLCVSEIALYGYGDDPGVIPFTGNVSSQSEASASSYSGGSVVRGVNGDSYLRTGPGLGYDRTGKVLHRGESATYLGSTSVDSRGVAWYKVRFDGREGWVSSRYTRLS